MTLYDQGQGVGAGLQGSPPSGVARLNLPCHDSPAFLGGRFEGELNAEAGESRGGCCAITVHWLLG